MERYKHAVGCLYQKIQPYLIPLVFSNAIVVNGIFYYVGLAYTDNILRSILFIVTSGLIGLASLYLAYTVLWKKQRNLRILIICALIVAFFLGCFLYAIFTWKQHPSTILYTAFKFCAFCVPAIFLGAYFGTKQNTDLYLRFEQLYLLVLPFFSVYIVISLLNISPFDSRGMGTINYMTISYGAMPFLFASIFEHYKGEHAFGGLACLRKFPRFRLFAIIISLLVIFSSRTRGVIVCVSAFFVLLIVYAIWTKNKFRSVLRLFALFIGLFLFFEMLYFPLFFSSSSRFEMLVQGLKQGELITSNENPAVREQLDVLVESETSAEEESLEETKSMLRSRGTLYRLAILETQKHPWTGLGPMGYTIKYVFYPHNAILELLCDLGIPLGGSILLAIAYCYVKIASASYRNSAAGFMLIFLSGYAVMHLISATVWAAPTLLFSIGFALTVKKKTP